MLSPNPQQNYEKNTFALRHASEVLKPQRLIDYNAAKKSTEYSAKMGAYYSPLRKVRD